LRWLFIRRFGVQDAEDAVQQCFAEVVEAIQRRGLNEPERLPGFVRTIAENLASARIQKTVERRSREQKLPDAESLADRGQSPETILARTQIVAAARRTLAAMRPIERELLLRFYVRQQSQEQICGELNLTSTQYRLGKSRAKSRFSALCQASLQPRRKPIAVQIPSIVSKVA
jgi:RNA polymerase sigma-70 factor (ECF subfamily)